MRTYTQIIESLIPTNDYIKDKTSGTGSIFQELREKLYERGDNHRFSLTSISPEQKGKGQIKS